MKTVILYIGVALLAFLFAFQAPMVTMTFKRGVKGDSGRWPTADAASAPMIHKKPLFILHIGPPKTATTTIQAFAASYARLFQKDGIHYIGNANMDGFFSTHGLIRACRTQGRESCSRQWREFQHFLEHHRTQNHTIFVSEENISDFHEEDEADCLWKFLLPVTDRWRVRVIYTYRRRFESLSSLYYQENNPNRVSPESMRVRYESWPDAHGKAIPSFREYAASKESNAFTDPLAVLKRWKSQYKTCIFNFHAVENLLQDFFCQMIPEARYVCRQLKSQVKDMVSNPSSAKPLHFDMVAVEAYRRGLINRTLTRKSVVAAVEAFSNELGYRNVTDFPLEQLTEHEAANLLNHSTHVELQLMPKFHRSKRGRTELETKFHQYMEEGRLASVDVPALLDTDERWIQFLSTL